MNRKTITLGTLFVAIVIGVTHQSMHAPRRGHRGRGRHRGIRHRGRGHRRGHIGFGVGFGHRRGHHRRHRRGHIGFGIGFGHRRRYYDGYYGRPYDYPISRYTWKDTQGLRHWEIHNASNVEITVSSSGRKILLQPGEKRSVRRYGSFVFEAQQKSGPLRSFETNNHYVTLYTGTDYLKPWKSKIKMRSTVDWSGD